MISITPFDLNAWPATEPAAAREDFMEVEYLLKRADEESIAAIRAVDPRVHESHLGMACGYSRASHALMAKLDAEGAQG